MLDPGTKIDWEEIIPKTEYKGQEEEVLAMVGHIETVSQLNNAPVSIASTPTINLHKLIISVRYALTQSESKPKPKAAKPPAESKGE